MRLSRRKVLEMGGGMAVALSALAAPASAASMVEITMQGRGDGSRVWFDPVGVLIQPGQTVRWINRDAGNSHTVTAYHPTNFDKPRRIPEAAAAWDSDYLLPEEAFSVILTQPGIYDYFCVPHEHAGMVGRIIVGSPQPPGWMDVSAAAAGIPEVALHGFPSIDEIMSKGTVRRL